MPLLDCPELAELDLEPVAVPFLTMHEAGSSIGKQKYNARKAVKLEGDHHHHHHRHHNQLHEQLLQQQNESHRRAAAAAAAAALGVRGGPKFKHVLGETCEPAWMSLMETPASIHLQQQEQHKRAEERSSRMALPPTTGTSASSVATTSEDKPKAEVRRYYPAPYCSCTGVNQQCYRWGNGGWQSACCTTKISVYPLPMNPKKKGSRVAGRKMSAGAFRKLLDRLSAEGVDVTASVDLRPHWAKHGTNRYVTIK